MTSNKPYLIRALYEWLVDNDATPHIMVNTHREGVMIPPGIDRDGQVVLNISMTAVRDLHIHNSHIAFSARFGGVSHDVYVPIPAVLAIYSLEDGEGMMFAEDSEEESTAATAEASEDASSSEQEAKPKTPKPGLTLVK